MKILKILLALFLTLANAQETQESDNTKDFESFEPTYSIYFFTLKGSIDSKYPITIKLVTDAAGDKNTIRAVNVKGVYLYDKFQKNILIYGELKQESLELFTESKEESFIFKLTQNDLEKILDDKKQPLNITGEWKSTPKGKQSKALQVVLSEVDLLEGKISRLDTYLMKTQKSYEPTQEQKEWMDDDEKLVTYYYEGNAFFIKPANIGILELVAKNMSFKEFEKAARAQMQGYVSNDFVGGSYEADTGVVASTKAIIFRSSGESFYRSTPHPNTIDSYAVFSIKDLAFVDTSPSAFVNVDKKFINFLQKELNANWHGGADDGDEAPNVENYIKYTTFRLYGEDIEVHFGFEHAIRSQDGILIPKAKIKPFVKKSSFFYDEFK